MRRRARLPIARALRRRRSCWPPAAATTGAARTRTRSPRRSRGRDQRRPRRLHRGQTQAFIEQTELRPARRPSPTCEGDAGDDDAADDRSRSPTSRWTATPPRPTRPSPAAPSTARRSRSRSSRKTTSGSSTRSRLRRVQRELRQGASPPHWRRRGRRGRPHAARRVLRAADRHGNPTRSCRTLPERERTEQLSGLRGR